MEIAMKKKRKMMVATKIRTMALNTILNRISVNKPNKCWKKKMKKRSHKKKQHLKKEVSGWAGSSERRREELRGVLLLRRSLNQMAQKPQWEDTVSYTHLTLPTTPYV